MVDNTSAGALLPGEANLTQAQTIDHFGPFWTFLDHLGTLKSLPWLAIWSKMDHFWAISSHERWTPNG